MRELELMLSIVESNFHLSHNFLELNTDPDVCTTSYQKL